MATSRLTLEVDAAALVAICEALTRRLPFLSPDLVDRVTEFADGPGDFVRCVAGKGDAGTAPGARHGAIRLEPTDRLRELMAAAGAGEWEWHVDHADSPEAQG